MKVYKSILKIVFICIMILGIFVLKVHAIDSVIQGADDFLNKGNKSVLNSASIKSVSDNLFSIFSTVGLALVLVVGVVLGIQFMMGSIEEKVKVKEALIPYVIGAIVIFGAIGIWTLVLNVLNSTFL